MDLLQTGEAYLLENLVCCFKAMFHYWFLSNYFEMEAAFRGICHFIVTTRVSENVETTVFSKILARMTFIGDVKTFTSVLPINEL